MNYIFMICTKDYLPYARECIRSLPKMATVSIYFYFFKPWKTNSQKKIKLDECSKTLNAAWNDWTMIDNFMLKILSGHKNIELELFYIDFNQWHNQIAYRKAILLHKFAMTQLKENDKVLVIDADLKFKCDPFKIFNNDSDIYYTTRHYEYHFPVNEGFWGFYWNEKTKNFIQFYKEQIENPTWEPYINWLKKYWHWGQKNWGIGQDFFCALWETYYDLPIEHRLEKYPLMKILPPQWNYCPSVEENDLENTLPKATKEIREAENNPDVKVLHYKGRLKEMM